MKLLEINNFINAIKNISTLATSFEFIGYELPKQHKNGAILIINDLDTQWDCFDINLIEFIVIWWVWESKSKIKSYSDLLDEKLLWFEILKYKVDLYDYSPVLLWEDWRFEIIKTYRVF